MDRLAIMQRIKSIKIFYKNDDSAGATYRALRGDYGLHKRPTMQAIDKIVKKFAETGGKGPLKGLCIIVSLVPLKILLL